MQDLTPKEKSLILRYTRDDYTDGDPTKETWAWSLCETRSEAAVWGSIVKKGYGWSNHTKERQAGYSCDTLGLTPKGVEAYRALSAETTEAK